MKIRTVLVASCVAASVFAEPSVAAACGSGGPGPSTPAAFKAATVVFLGTVEKVTGEVPRAIVATFLITKAYRGAVQQRVIVSGYCDVAFSKGDAAELMSPGSRSSRLVSQNSRPESRC